MSHRSLMPGYHYTCLFYILYISSSSLQRSLQLHSGRNSSNRVGEVTKRRSRMHRLMRCVLFQDSTVEQAEVWWWWESAKDTSCALLYTSPCPSFPRRLHVLRFNEPGDIPTQYSNGWLFPLCVWNPPCCQNFLQKKKTSKANPNFQNWH